VQLLTSISSDRNVHKLLLVIRKQRETTWKMFVVENVQFPNARCQIYVTVRLTFKSEVWWRDVLGLVLRSHQVCKQD